MSMEESFIIAKRWTQSICLSTGELTHTLIYVHTKEYYSAMKNNEGLIQAVM